MQVRLELLRPRPRGVGRGRGRCGRLFLRRLVPRGLYALVADIVEGEVLLGGQERDGGALDVDIGVEGLAELYGLALEGGLEASEATIVDDLTLSYQFAPYRQRG